MKAHGARRDAVDVLDQAPRLEAGETDGWRYADMPEDGQAWRDTLSYLDEDAGDRCGTPFAWDEIGKREPLETPDAKPAEDPVRVGAS
jgi:hypothetical protein